MIKQRMAIQLFALMFVVPATAVADNLPPLPVPHIVNTPSRVPEGPHRTVNFSFASTLQSPSGYSLNYNVQQWSCPPGKDNPPVGNVLPSPWAGQQAYCQQEDNSGGMYKPGASTLSSGSAYLPVRGERFDPGTVYVRVRLYWSEISGSNRFNGGWSAWHRTLVEDTHRAVFTGTKGMSMKRKPAGSMHIKVDMKGVKAPMVTAPMEGKVFHGGPINISGSVGPHNPYSDWTCCFFQWKRAVIVAPENNTYAQAHTPGHSAFPTPPTPWSGQGFFSNDAIGVKEHGPSFHGRFLYNDIRPHDHTFGYRYMFRVREEHYDQYGPWSPWRSFVVQEPIMAATPYHGGMQVRPGAHVSKPSSGQQQNSHKLAPMVPMHIR